MTKTVKKLDSQVIKALTIACEAAKQQVKGFEWLTHTADYANFPSSLVVRCVFDREANLVAAKQNSQDQLFAKLIHAELLRAGVLLKTPKRHVIFDTEEACMRDHDGSWKQRLKNVH